MADLLARTAFDGALPVTFGTVTLSEMTPTAITSVAPFHGQADAVSSALQKQIGLGLPKANRHSGDANRRITWAGLDQAFFLGPRPDPIPGAAMTDQTDAWAAFALDGADAREVLARLVPIDLRLSVFKVGHAARTQLGHMSALLMHVGEDRYEGMVFRSMAGTAVHDLTRAMRAMAARR